MPRLPRLPRALRRMPLWREPLRRTYKRHAPQGPVHATYEGLSFALAPADNKVDFDIWYKQRLEEGEERAFLAAHLLAGEWFVDIGANIGLYTLSLLAAVPGAKAVAFEPFDRLRTRLKTNLALNGMEGRVSVRPEAIGPAGRLTLHQSLNAGASSLLPFDGSRPGSEVDVVPLSQILAELDAVPAALKIDVEGFEDAALMPYFDTAPSSGWPRAVVIETLHRGVWKRDCLQELFKRGYSEVGRTDENALLLRT